MALQVIRSARANYSLETYVGDKGQIFYREELGDFRLSDGRTPGGIELLSGGFSPSFVDSLTELVAGDIEAGDFLVVYDDSTDSLRKIRFDNLPTGYTGSQGEIGYSGSQGEIGYSGSSGFSNLVFSENGDTRTLTNFKDDQGETFTVRSTIISNGVFTLSLASFTPTLSAVVLPSASLNWDVPAQGFTVTINNPDDFTSRYISAVRSIQPTGGSITADLGSYTTTGPTATPAGGIDWQQTFSTNQSANIYSTSTSINGGSASAIVRFDEYDNEEIEYQDSTATFAVSWITPTLTVAIADLSGNNFLQSYDSAAYAVTVTGIGNPANYALAITSVGGSVSNPVGNGSFTFSSAIHKNNVSDARSVSVSATFTRPIGVTGVSYSSIVTAQDTSFSKVFTFLSFWVFTDSVFQPPQLNDIVTANNFKIGVTVLGNQAKTFSGSVTNSAATPRVFWLGVRSSAGQPSVFKTGASASLLSDVATTTASVLLNPDPAPSGYISENYSLYGIILQPGSTYVSIS